MFIHEGLNPLTELVIWISYAVMIIIVVMAVGIFIEFTKKK